MLQIINWAAAARWNTHSHFETLIRHNKLGTLIVALRSIHLFFSMRQPLHWNCDCNR